MPSDIRYVFVDALSGTILEEIPLQSVRFTQTLNGGEFNGTFGLDLSGYDNEQLVSATIPGRCLLIAETDNVVHWGGLIWTRTYQSQAKSVQLYAKTLDQYPTKRKIDFDREFTDVDPRNIMLQLYTDMQADPNSIMVDLPSVFATSDPIDYDVVVAEMKTYRSAMDQISTGLNGFEWMIKWSRSGNTYNKRLEIGQPLGQLLGDTNPVFEYPGNILNYWRNDTIGSGGTNIFGVGAGEGESMPVVEVVHTDLLSGGFPRLDAMMTFKDVEDDATLTELTQTQAWIARAPQPVYNVQMKADREPAFGDYALGDYCKLVIKDPLHPSPGKTYATRILGWDYTPPQSDSVAEVQLIFEGDDDA
jgi:hypothetical protein